jgi:kynurenine formamidase
MCDACVIETVKRRMLNRRDLLRRAALVGAGAAASVTGGGVLAPAARAETPGRIEDLTHLLHEGFPTFSGEQQFWMDEVRSFAEHGYHSFDLRMHEHMGTHIDAPLHFAEETHSVAEIPVADLVLPLVVVDIRAKAADDPDAQVTPDDLAAWTDAHGPIPARACVALLSGWAERADGDGFRNADADGVMHFPGFHIEAAEMLLEETDAVALAVDTLSLDHGPSQDFAVHYAWLGANRYGIECVAGLDRLPASGATLIVGAPKFARATGGQARILALV